MKTDTALRIQQIITEKKQVRPHDLLAVLPIKTAALHRQLKKLCEAGVLKKSGTPPHVFYFLATKSKNSKINDTSSLLLSSEDEGYLQSKYLYIDPIGMIEPGVSGFRRWLQAVNEEKNAQPLLAEYLKTRRDVDRFLVQGRIDATLRLKNIFPDLVLEKIYYQDFYSIPKFGKTKLGQLVLHGKQAQDKKIIHRLAHDAKPVLMEICKAHHIEAVAWAPHSLPRKVPFLKEFEKTVQLPFPRVDILKSYAGEIPVAQKSLSKLAERILNASETIMIKSQDIPYKKILLIDDAVGSGATLQEIAKKLRDRGAEIIIGFAIVGSYKGFEVIKEV